MIQVESRQSRATCGFHQNAMIGQKAQACADGLSIADLNAGGGMRLADGVSLVADAWCSQGGGNPTDFAKCDVLALPYRLAQAGGALGFYRNNRGFVPTLLPQALSHTA